MAQESSSAHLGSVHREVWLTLDDGPHPSHTRTIAKVLKDAGISALFFIIGREAAKHPEVVEELFEAGHRIGNHSYTHADLTELSASEVRDEFLKTEEILGHFLGDKKLFRPPFGNTNSIVAKVANDLNYHTVLWDVSTSDWSEEFQPNRWVKTGVDLIAERQKSLVLNHDNRETTAAYYQSFIQQIQILGPTTFLNPHLI